MELKLSLFVHGVPNGQKIWGPKEADLIFIESFYGRKSKVDVQLLVDIFESGAGVNCYYTFLKSENILAKDGRPGSYFALTVRVNAYYADLFNMYNILYAAYQKLILGTILNENAVPTRFIIDDFSQVNGELEKIEKEVKKYLSYFSVNADFIGLNGFDVNSSAEPATVSLIECNNKNVITHVKAKGNISVSPQYPASQFLEQIRKKDEEIENIRRQADQQVADGIKKSEQEIISLKNEYASADKTITDLRNTLDIEQKRSTSLSESLQKANDRITEQNQSIQRLSSREKDFNEANTILKEIKKLLNDFEAPTPAYQPRPVHRQPSNRSSRPDNPYSKLLLVLIIIIAALILGAALYFLIRQSPEHIRGNDADAQENQQIQSSNPPASSSNSREESPQHKSIKLVNINIDEFSKNDTFMDISKQYHIKAKSIANKGKWITNDFNFNSDSTAVTPNHPGDCEIKYAIDNQVVGSRKIMVK